MISKNGTHRSVLSFSFVLKGERKEVSTSESNPTTRLPDLPFLKTHIVLEIYLLNPINVGGLELDAGEKSEIPLSLEKIQRHYTTRTWLI